MEQIVLGSSFYTEAYVPVWNLSAIKLLDIGCVGVLLDGEICSSLCFNIFHTPLSILGNPDLAILPSSDILELPNTIYHLAHL